MAKLVEIMKFNKINDISLDGAFISVELQRLITSDCSQGSYPVEWFHSPHQRWQLLKLTPEKKSLSLSSTCLRNEFQMLIF